MSEIITFTRNRVPGYPDVYECDKLGNKSGQYVKLSDCETLQAENAKLRKALEKAMRFLDKVSVQTDSMDLVAAICLLREMEFEPLLGDKNGR